MSGQLKKLGRHTVVYSAGIIIGKVASFVMLPVYTRYLTPADYGVLELLGMTLDVIGMITGIGLVAGVFKFYSAAESPAAKKAVMSTAALGVIALATATTVVGQALAPELAKLIFGSGENLLFLRLYFVLFFLQNFEYVPFLLMRAENRSVLFVTINALKLVSMLSLNIVFVVNLRMGIKGVLAAGIITSAAVTVGLTLYLVRRVGIGFSTEKFRQMLTFGSPMVLWSLASFILVFSDRFFLNHYTDTSTVGIYSLAYKFAFVLSALAYGPFEMIWDVQRFEIAKRPDAQELYSRVFLYMNVILGGVGLVLSLFVRDFLYVMSDHAFLPAYRLVPLLIAAQVVFTWAGFWNLGLYISGRTRVMASGAAVLVSITLILNYMLIPWFGIYGAAWATLIAYATRFLWVYHFAQRYYPIRYDWKDIAKLYGILGAAVVLRFAYHPGDLLASIGWSMGLLVTSLGLVYTLVLSVGDRATLRSVGRRILSRRDAAPSGKGRLMFTGKARKGYRKLLNTAKVALDPAVPVITFYDYNRNWGDALNLVLVQHISGRKAVAVQNLYNFRDRPVYSVIGSILGTNNFPNLEVWGSGFIGADRTFQTVPRKIHAVRGPLTRQLVLNQGLSCPAVYGDPALLYPRYYAPSVEKQYDLGIVPHYIDRDIRWVNRAAHDPNVLIIDVLGGVQEFVDQLCRCRLIASSSLHGLIAADAYGIPFAWISLSNRVIGDGFKFRDYFLSTGRNDVEPVAISDETSLGKIYDFAVDSAPEIDLDLLLEACPFGRHAIDRG